MSIAQTLPNIRFSLYCEYLQELVAMECKRWANKGINIKYETRDNRNGYKAGALKEGMKHDYVKNCDYVAIFDADFQPEPDFLWRTIPFLMHNSELALVQTRWKFGKFYTPYRFELFKRKYRTPNSYILTINIQNYERATGKD